ncbi:uncharacterized protein LOC143144912 [Ptiloglossa arizonensis]|uniref:uncharacterized protein LOC143144912 n=1 Tax=Ptiloglossa arizonensis TaxID=3350558 RepID=UPI003F9F2373
MNHRQIEPLTLYTPNRFCKGLKNIYRDFFFHFTTVKIIATNLRCIVKPQIVSDPPKPTVTLKLPEPEIGSEKTVAEKKEANRRKNKVQIKPGNKHRGVFL